MNLLGKLNLNVLSYFEHRELPIGTISDDRYFAVLSASECLRFKIQTNPEYFRIITTACLKQKCKKTSGFCLKGMIIMCTTIRINMKETGNNISRLRKQKGIAIKQIQEAMGFNTPQAIYKWVRGETMPTLDNMLVLSELFNTTINEIVVKEK